MPVDSYREGISYNGLHNMAGNDFEWVSDWYDPKFYGRLEPMVNPTGPAKPVWIGGTGTHVDFLTLGEKRVIRGGSWIAPEATLRVPPIDSGITPATIAMASDWDFAVPRLLRPKSNSKSNRPIQWPWWRWAEKTMWKRDRR